MKIQCSRCGKNVSNAELPEDTVIRAWIECPECIANSKSTFDKIFEIKQKCKECKNG